MCEEAVLGACGQNIHIGGGIGDILDDVPPVECMIGHLVVVDGKLQVNNPEPSDGGEISFSDGCSHGSSQNKTCLGAIVETGSVGTFTKCIAEKGLMALGI
jgi:hypothetical protein